MHNARNTDYLVPYGIARFLDHAEHGETALAVLSQTWDGLGHPGHFLHAVDDRYLSHYIGHSYFRFLRLLQERSGEPDTVSPAPVPLFCEGSQHRIVAGKGTTYTALVSGKKGGILTAWFDGGCIADFGWTFDHEGKQWVTHWWSDGWVVDNTPASLSVAGHFTPHTEQESSPVKHMALRVLSFVLGRRIIGLLKEKLIFKQSAHRPYAFQRSIRWEPTQIILEDVMDMPSSPEPLRAPRASKRHVASADSYQREDLGLCVGNVTMKEERKQEAGRWIITTTYKQAS